MADVKHVDEHGHAGSATLARNNLNENAMSHLFIGTNHADDAEYEVRPSRSSVFGEIKIIESSHDGTILAD